MSGNLEHLRGAVRVLVGPGAVKQRLLAAYLGHLRGIEGDALPDAICIDFAALQSALACVRPVVGQCAAEAAIRKMSDSDAAAHAERILEMFLVMSGAALATTEPASPPRLRVVGDDDDLPAFISRA